MNQVETPTPKDYKIDKLTTEILDNIDISKTDEKYSKKYTEIYNLLRNKKFSAVQYGC
ncbi:hypothetical protein MWH28_00410 [Natroniella sulfidigena]|uniref:hypothetical protein n=1 Tax=Natroniella sulfidigena TaxID=723921 RepID=UPI00200B216D|nr:hypothetical protein [Natroniella sulfidigena]MCK8815828.1 hypothetical protein [Natroniella sulfidigena]